MPERLQALQTDVQRLVELVQDPRPVEEKQDVLRRELEDTVVEFLEKGTTIEQDVLSNIKSLLPPEAANALSELIPEPPNKVPQYGPVVPVDPVDPYGATYGVGFAADSATAVPPLSSTMYGAQDVKVAQIASEISEIRLAVGGLKTALESIRNNSEAASSTMLRLRLREARDQLQRRLLEVSPANTLDPSLSAAIREATLLLDEVNAMFFSAPASSP